MISHLAKEVLESLKLAFPNTLIKSEEYVNYKGQRLFFDFYLPSLNVYIEVQGIQHSQFNSYFFKDATAFKNQKKRDSLKKEWCSLNDMTLICVNFDEIPISTQQLLDKIQEAQNYG